MVETTPASPDPICEANIAYVPRRTVLRSCVTAYVTPMRGITEFHTIAFLIGVALTAGRTPGSVTLAGVEAAPSEPACRSHRNPRFAVRRSFVHVSPKYALE